MIKLVTDICVDVPMATAWQQMAKIDEVHLWADLSDSYCTSDKNRGVGAERACVLPNGTIINELFTEWDDGKSFTYKVSDGLPGIMKSAQNHWTLTPEGEGMTLIRSEVTLEIKGGVFGRLMEPVISWGIKRQLATMPATLKYFVENGHGYEGSPKDLPKAPSFC